MRRNRYFVPAFLASLILSVAACGDSATAPLHDNTVVSETIVLTDSMYRDSVWSIPSAVLRARVATIAVPAITSDIAANGLVLVYMNTTNAPDTTVEWSPLPINAGFNYLLTFTYAYTAGQIQIGFYDTPTDTQNPLPDVYNLILAPTEFKIVIAKGSSI